MSPLEGLAASPLGTSGREPIVEITPEALEKLIELRDAEPDGESLGLRLELASEPGEPFRYDLSFDEYLSAAFTDEVRSVGGAQGDRARSATSTSCKGRRSTTPSPRVW